MSNWSDVIRKRPASGSERKVPEAASATISPPDHESHSSLVAARNSFARR
jgi:hypothetical protein